MGKFRKPSFNFSKLKFGGKHILITLLAVVIIGAIVWKVFFGRREGFDAYQTECGKDRVVKITYTPPMFGADIPPDFEEFIRFMTSYPDDCTAMWAAHANSEVNSVNADKFRGFTPLEINLSDIKNKINSQFQIRDALMRNPPKPVAAPAQNQF